MVTGEADIARVTFQSGYQGLRSVVPDFNSLVVRCTEQVGLVTVGIVVDMVDSLLVSLNGLFG